MRGQQILGRALKGLMRPSMQMRRAQLAQLPLPAGRVLFLGDSITEQGMWQEWLPSVPVLNRGVGGDTVGGVRVRLDAAVNDPTVISLLIGTNDLSGMGVSTKTKAIAEQVAELVSDLQARAPRARLLINSVMPRTASFASTITDLNAHYRVIARDSGARYIDLWPVLAQSNGAIRPELSADNLHLNGNGYEAWLSVLGPELATGGFGGTGTSGVTPLTTT